MKKKDKQPKQREELDMETTFADMNVDGFSWYDPSKKKNGGKSQGKIYLTREEKWAMFKAGASVLWPFILGVVGLGVVLYLILALWMG